MDKITERLSKAIKARNGHEHFPINVGTVVCDGIERSAVRDISWRVETVLNSSSAQTFFLRYDEYGTVSVFCSADVVVDISAVSGDKLVIKYMELKGGDPDCDVEIVIEKADKNWPTEERFLWGKFIRRWPHLREHANVLFELGALVQEAVFESVTADLLTLVEA